MSKQDEKAQQAAAERAAPEPAQPADLPQETVEGNPIEPGTTRDATDLGVPMLPGDPGEPQGPEDALGVGPKRGDYTNRIGPSHYQPHESRRTESGHTVVEAQRPRAEDQGDEPGVKGGVGTDPLLQQSRGVAGALPAPASTPAPAAPPSTGSTAGSNATPSPGAKGDTDR